jgi:MFS family permease
MPDDGRREVAAPEGQRLSPRGSRWGDWLGLSSSTLALLGAILLVTAGVELWSPLIPQYLKALQAQAHGGEVWVIVMIGAYGFYRDLLEAINYYTGGVLAGRLNTRRSLLLFNVLPLIGLAMLALWESRVAVFLAVPFVFVWDSIAGPATITVVGDALPADRRTMAFSLQSIFRRVSRFFAYGVGALAVWWFGAVDGLRANLVIAILFVLLALAVQYRFMHTAGRDAALAIHRPLAMLRRFPPDLKRLLVADVAARWAEGLAREFAILYCVPLLAAAADVGTARYQGVLLNVQVVMNIVVYVVVGPLASRAGLAKKPYIGLTFLFFALFPVCLSMLGPALGFAGLILAFAVGGMREIGEPARKAMIAELVPPDVRTQAIGLYWSVRSAAVMWAPPAGALLWIAGDRWQPGLGPHLVFWTAGILGLIGAAAFFARFGTKQLNAPY